MDDDEYRGFQEHLLVNPDSGDVIVGTGGLRKIRHGDAKRGKGKRGGLRVIYYWWNRERQFFLFTVYGKDEKDDLNPAEKKILKGLLKAELEARK